MQRDISQAIELQHSQVVTRCGCGDPDGMHPVLLDNEGNPYRPPCPTPRRVDDLGVVAYYHRQQGKRLLGTMRVFLNGIRTRQARKG